MSGGDDFAVAAAVFGRSRIHACDEDLTISGLAQIQVTIVKSSLGRSGGLGEGIRRTGNKQQPANDGEGSHRRSPVQDLRRPAIRLGSLPRLAAAQRADDDVSRLDPSCQLPRAQDAPCYEEDGRHSCGCAGWNYISVMRDKCRAAKACPHVCIGETTVLHPSETFGQSAFRRTARQPTQRSICSEISSASSTSMPRYLTVLSSFPWPSRSWQARKLPVFL